MKTAINLPPVRRLHRRRIGWMRNTGWLLFMTVFCLASTPLPAADTIKAEQAKVIYIYNILKLTRWQNGDEENPPLDVCVFSKRSEDFPIGSLEGRTAGKRKITVKYFPNLEGTVKECDLLYIPQEKSSQWPQASELLDDRPVLTISDMKDFTTHEGLVGFITVEGKLRFSLNVKQAEKIGISFSAKLHEIAYTRVD